jgi:hypothetical protein
VDAGRQVDRDLGRGEAVARRLRDRHGQPIPFRARRRTDLNAPVRVPVRVPPSFRSECSATSAFSRRRARRLQRARASLHASAATASRSV